MFARGYRLTADRLDATSTQHKTKTVRMSPAMWYDNITDTLEVQALATLHRKGYSPLESTAVYGSSRARSTHLYLYIVCTEGEHIIDGQQEA